MTYVVTLLRGHQPPIAGLSEWLQELCLEEYEEAAQGLLWEEGRALILASGLGGGFWGLWLERK